MWEVNHAAKLADHWGAAVFDLDWTYEQILAWVPSGLEVEDAAALDRHGVALSELDWHWDDPGRDSLRQRLMFGPNLRRLVRHLLHLLRRDRLATRFLANLLGGHLAVPVIWRGGAKYWSPIDVGVAASCSSRRVSRMVGAITDICFI